MPKTSRPLELLWLDPKHMARIRRQPAWRRLLDDPLQAPSDLGVPALYGQDVPSADRRDVLLVLSRADATNGEGVATALSEGVREDGKFAPPLVLVAGELRLPFDELEVLKATVTTAVPFVAGDEALKMAVDAARDFLSLPGLSPAPAVVDLLTGRIREAFGRVKRAVPAGYLEAQTDRVLLEQRRYQRRMFRGAPYLRGLVQAGGEKGPGLVYLPESVATALPLFQRFEVRVIAEGHLSVDQYEGYPYALEALALAREMAAAAPRRGLGAS